MWLLSAGWLFSVMSAKCGYFLLDIYINCDFCQSVPQNVTIFSWILKKVAIVIQIHKMRLMSIGSIQNVAIVSLAHKMWPLSVGSIQNVGHCQLGPQMGLLSVGYIKIVSIVI